MAKGSQDVFEKFKNIVCLTEAKYVQEAVFWLNILLDKQISNALRTTMTRSRAFLHLRVTWQVLNNVSFLVAIKLVGLHLPPIALQDMQLLGHEIYQELYKNQNLWTTFFGPVKHGLYYDFNCT